MLVPYAPAVLRRRLPWALGLSIFTSNEASPHPGEEFMHFYKTASAIAFLISLNTNAAVLIDTGSPPLTQNGAVAVCNNGSWCVQSVALQVAFDQPVSIQSIEAWLWVKNPGELTASLYSDSQGLPGSFIESTALAVDSTERGWKAVNQLSWRLKPGNYWVAFSVESGQMFDGALDFPAPTKLPAAVNNTYFSNWTNVGGGAGGGLRVYGDTLPAVPEPNSPALVIAGAAVLLMTSRSPA
jgi:hypothetical protein